MASIFGHGFTAFAIGKQLKKKYFSPKLIIIGIVCSIFPDADVIGFKFGIAYESFWGHRGFTHSFVFAILLATMILVLFYRKIIIKDKLFIGTYLFICTASHGLLDILTDGGKGVALLAPFDNTRYFSPFRPIKVSPIGISNFFSNWGMKVILSELIWIGLPCILLIFIAKYSKK
jgi:inner membrane protein